MEKIIATKENRGSIRIWLEESINNRYLSDNGFVKGSRFDVAIEVKTVSMGWAVDKRIALTLNENGKQKVSGNGDRSIIDIVRKAEKLPIFVNPRFKDSFKLMADPDRSGTLLLISIDGEKSLNDLPRFKG